MARLVWDRLEDRTYEIGADRAVLYVPDEDNVFIGVAWNGLTKVTKESTRETQSTYFDGMKIHDYIQQTEFKGSMDAIMYPREFERLEGSYEIKCGVSLGEQPPGMFGLCYRTMVGDVLGERSGYKLHILFNLQATPSEKVYETMGDSPKLMEFSWDLESLPEPLPNHRPTAEITLDSRRVDPLLMADLENLLYGTALTDPYLPPMQDLVEMIDDWFRLRITVDSDGVFTVEERIDGTHVFPGDDDTWELRDVIATYSEDGDSYTVEDISCIPPSSGFAIRIEDHGNGQWSAYTDFDTLITVDRDENSPTYGEFTIDNATVLAQSDDAYIITDTPHD